MRINRRSLFFLAGTGFLLVVFWAIFQAIKPDPHFQRVFQILENAGSDGSWDHQGLEDLNALGPKAYPSLARILQNRDSPWEKFYDRFREKTPDWLKSKLPQRKSKAPLRDRAAWSIPELGPTASRALLGPIGSTLGELGMIHDQYLLRALYWSIPESQKAKEILKEWLAEPGLQKLLFGMIHDQEIWPTVPELAPLLVEWLKLPDQAGEAAAGLALMGTNAVLAIPGLIQVAQYGAAGDPPNLQLSIRYLTGDPITSNRSSALYALGKIGIDSPEVFSTFEKAFADSNAEIRTAAARAAGSFGPNGEPLIALMVPLLSDQNRFVVEAAIQSVGQIGTDEVSIVSLLQQWADLEYANQKFPPEDPRPGLPPRLSLSTLAGISLCKINPELGKPWSATIANGLTNLFPEPDLEFLQVIGEELAMELTPALNDGPEWQKFLVAYHILYLSPDHEQAKNLLLEGLNHSDSDLKSAAAFYLWKAGEKDQCFPILRAALLEVKKSGSQSPLYFTGRLGPEARDLAPAIQPLLLHNDWAIRMVAGKTLKKIAPEALPPIRENPF